jgi:hypothetical protein
MEHEPHIETYGELAPQFMIELVAGDAPGAGLELLLWDGAKQYIQSSVRLEAAPGSEFKAREYRAPEVDSSIPRAIRFPTHAEPYESDRQLLDEISALIDKYTGLTGKLASLAAYAVLASWLVDCIESPVCLSIIGPQSTGARQLVRLLACLYRRALRLSEMTLAGVSSLPMLLRPALFIEHYGPNKDLQKLLRVSSARDTYVPRNGRLLDLSCAMVICSEGPLDADAGGSSIIEIPITPSRKPLPILDARAQQQIADRFQPLLLMFRLKHYKQVAGSDFDVPEFAPSVRELARSLGACVSDEPDLREGIAILLAELNALALSERATDLNAIVVEAMLSFCHEAKKESLHVGAITARVSEILEQRGELLEMKPKTVGHKLKALGLATRRLDAAGRGVLLLDAVRERIHKLGMDYQLSAGHGMPSCRHCRGQIEATRGGMNTSDLDDLDGLL